MVSTKRALGLLLLLRRETGRLCLNETPGMEARATSRASSVRGCKEGAIWLAVDRHDAVKAAPSSIVNIPPGIFVVGRFQDK